MPNDITRQQRRRHEREQLKSGRALASTGLTASPKREAMRDVARLMHTKLMERDNAERASEAAAIAQELVETSLRRYPNQVEIACRKGCYHCCATFVGALPAEIFRIADLVRSGRAPGLDPAGVAERAAPLKGVAAPARLGAKLMCPLLVEGACGVYEVRPLVCRQTTSLSVAACIEEYEGQGGSSDTVEVSSAHLAHSGNAHVGLLGALLAAGLPTKAYELSSGLVVALADRDSERRWLAGEDVFASLPDQVERPAVVDQVARAIAADLKA